MAPRFHKPVVDPGFLGGGCSTSLAQSTREILEAMSTLGLIMPIET